MKLRPIPWLLVIGLLGGLALGLVTSWVIFPATYVDTTPATLRNDFKDQYRLLVASAYASTGDLTRAESRLALLNDTDSAKALADQARTLLAESGPSETVRMLAALADALHGSGVVIVPPVLAPSQAGPQTETVPFSETDTPAEATAPPSTLATHETGGPTPTEFITPIITIVARATREPTATPGAPFTLVSADTLCDPSLPAGLLEIIVRDRSGKPVPGVEIVITWNAGEEHFFTGLKPELGNGYADYRMSAGAVYAVRLTEGGVSAPDIAIPSCPGDPADSPSGILRLIFQQP